MMFVDVLVKQMLQNIAFIIYCLYPWNSHARKSICARTAIVHCFTFPTKFFTVRKVTEYPFR